MADVFSKEKRSEVMARVRGKDTKPEMTIRRALHARGFRFRLHRKDLPGKPDIVLPKYRAVIFVHGCFWHGHDCHLFKWPKTREDFWRQKIGRNRERDAQTRAALRAAEWRCLMVWECALVGKFRVDPDDVLERICAWLPSGGAEYEIEGVRT